jgi:hypothetical protein
MKRTVGTKGVKTRKQTQTTKQHWLPVCKLSQEYYVLAEVLLAPKVRLLQVLPHHRKHQPLRNNTVDDAAHT